MHLALPLATINASTTTCLMQNRNMAAVVDIGCVEVSTVDHAKRTFFLVTCKICHEDFTMEGEDNIHTTKPCGCKYFCEGCLSSYVHISLQNAEMVCYNVLENLSKIGLE